MEKSVKIGILDKHKFVHDCVKILCSSSDNSFELVSNFICGDEFYNCKMKSEIDILICDVNLPLDKGLSFCSKVRREFPDMKILVFSLYTDLRPITKIFMTGVHCYLPKTSSLEELLNALKELVKSGFYYLYDLSVIFSAKKHKNLRSHIPIFSKKELDIIELVRSELTAREISTKLGLHIKTVEMHKRNILDKTNSKKMIGALDYLLSNRIILPNHNK